MLVKPPLGAYLNYGHWSCRGLVGCWLMNEGAGSVVYDLSGNNKNGTKSSAASWGLGKYGHAVVTEGAGAKITVPTPALTGNGTIVFSFNGSGTPAHGYAKFFITTDNELQLQRANSDTVVWFSINYDVDSHLVIFNVPDLWGTGEHIIAITWCDATNLTECYVDSVKTDDDTMAFSWPSLSSSLYIGDRVTNDRNIGGRFSFFHSYNRVLSASEIASLYLYPFQMFDDDLPVLVGAAASPSISTVDIYVYDTDEEIGNVA